MTNFEVDDHFRQWWDEDWSWEGLANKPWKGGDEDSTIQDYWLKEKQKDRLVDFAGRTWTRFHLPLHDLDGNLSDKASWSHEDFRDFSMAINRRLREKANELRPLSREEHLTMETNVPFNGLAFPASFDFSEAGDPLFADFLSARFSDNTNFTATNFPYKAKFRNAAFGRDANFKDAKFQDTADFDDTVFGPFANFSIAYFQSIARFIGAAFGFEASFEETTFYGSANFSWATFGHLVYFRSAKFRHNAFFSAAIFNGVVIFADVEFHGALNFEGATFDLLADFGAIVRPDGGNNAQGEYFQKISFEEAIFNGDVSFDNRRFLGETDFSFVKFYGVPEFHNTKIHQNTTFHGATFPGIQRTRRERLARLYIRLYADPRKLPSLEQENKRVEQYERGYRRLRHIMEELRNPSKELEYFSYELECLRNRTDTALTERILGGFYRIFSDYGRSIKRPLLWWSAMNFLLFPFAYKTLANGMTDLSWTNAIRFTMEQSVRPFSIWTSRYRESTENIPTDAWLSSMLKANNWPALEIVASVQAAFSLALVLLLFLGIRRSFRKN